MPEEIDGLGALPEEDEEQGPALETSGKSTVSWGC